MKFISEEFSLLLRFFHLKTNNIRYDGIFFWMMRIWCNFFILFFHKSVHVLISAGYLYNSQNKTL